MSHLFVVILWIVTINYMGKLAIEDDYCTTKNSKLLKASKIAADIREHIYVKLKYRVSAGIAKNKLLAKLGSAKNKPNNQTVILEDHIIPFLKDLPITKLRSLGGKMGTKLIEGLPGNTCCSSLWELEKEDLAERLDGSPAIGEWTFNFLRGQDPSPVEDRSLIKSFMSVKNFLRPITNGDLLKRWTSLLFHELGLRVMEERSNSNRWPRSLSIKYTTKTQQRSKSMEFLLQPSDIPIRNPIMVDGIYKLLELDSTSTNTGLFPLNQLSLGINNFQSLAIKRIDSFTLHKIDPWERDRITRVISDCIGGGGGALEKPIQQNNLSKTKKSKKSKNNKSIDSFLNKTATPNNEECWMCPKCSKRIQLDWMVIEEHENYHLAEEFVI